MIYEIKKLENKLTETKEENNNLENGNKKVKKNLDDEI